MHLFIEHVCIHAFSVKSSPFDPFWPRHLCDVVFFSSDFIRSRAADLQVVLGDGAEDWQTHGALRCLRAMATQASATRVAELNGLTVDARWCPIVSVQLVYKSHN